MKPLWAWISPFDNFQTVDDVVAACSRIALDGFEVGVLLPTLYDDYPQSDYTINLGQELIVDSPETALAIRDALAERGVRCGGWSVPRATGDVAAEGYKHGEMAAAFDTFVLNYEDGWRDFWTADGAPIVNVWLGGFWAGVEDHGGTAALNGNVGVTMVTNTAMMHALSDDEARAWVEGTNFDALEAYVPGDPGLDPGKARVRWEERLYRIAQAARPFVIILEQGDLPALARQHAHPLYGVHLWTLQTAADYDWPAVPAPEDDVLIPDDYVTKFGLSDNHDVQGLIDNFEGVINDVRDAADREGRSNKAKLEEIRDILEGHATGTTPDNSTAAERTGAQPVDYAGRPLSGPTPAPEESGVEPLEHTTANDASAEDAHVGAPVGHELAEAA